MRSTSAPPSLLQRSAAWATLAPALCALHCLAAPLLVTLAPALHPGETGERLIFAATVLVAALVLGEAARRHRRAAPLLVAAAGAAVWAMALAHLLPTPEEPTAAAGGLVLAAGMAWSAHLRHRATCARCGCPAHDGEEPAR